MTSDHARATAAPTATQHATRLDAPAGLVLATACHRCGAGVPSVASDFCEHCSAHLYPGHCVFCLEAFTPAQAYCRTCGLPPEGVTCGACGTFSRFDFCPNPDCGAGLTSRAAAELERLESDPEVLEAFAELDEIAAVMAAVESDAELPPETTSRTTSPITSPITSHTAAKSSARTSFGAPPGTHASGASEATSSTSTTSTSTHHPSAATFAQAPRTATTPPRPSLAALRAAAQGAKSAEEKARVRLLAQQAAQDSMNAVASRPFPTAQEARAAGTALQVALRCRVVSERLETIAWRCNTFGTEHPEPGGMSLCSDPSGGGVPIMQVITEIDDRSTEFTA